MPEVRGTYLTILPDDDAMVPGFIQDSVASWTDIPRQVSQPA
jgi:hypothetical protein